jgi:hypothetical protein
MTASVSVEEFSGAKRMPLRPGPFVIDLPRAVRIYIDEAGAFVAQPAGQPLFSLVLAVVVPSSIELQLTDEFSRLLAGWPHQEAEIKGSKLDESQAAQLIDLVSRHDVIVQFFAVDMEMHGDKVVDDFKARQADAVTENLTSEHHPPIAAQLRGLADAIRRMPNQLFVQAFLMIELVLRVIEESTLYYVQRLPKELGSIEWVIDRKDRKITEMEKTWSTLILPMSESHFVKKPLICLRGADYSPFDARYGIRADDEEMNRHVAWTREAYGIQGADQSPGLNAGLLLSEQRQFLDSAGSLGLQLADMLAAILRRALNNRLQPEGWSRIGRLFIVDKTTPFLLFSSADVGGQTFGSQIERFWRALKTGNKKMVVRPGA